MMYAGGVAGDPRPMLTGPQNIGSGLIGTAQNYNYPMTSGLLGAISNAGGVGPFTQQLSGVPDYTQTALQLAGNPHAGPYATNLGKVPPGVVTPTAGSTSGGSTGSNVLGGLLGALGSISKSNPGLLNSLGGAIKNLLGGSPNVSGIGSALGGNTADSSFMNTDLGSFNSVFGSPTASSDVMNSTGITPAFDTGFMSSGASGLAGNMNYDSNYGSSDGSYDYGGGFSGAGGQAAEPQLQDPGVSAATSSANLNGIDYPSTDTSGSNGMLGGAGNALGVVGGLASGTPTGYASAALNAAALANRAGIMPSGTGSAIGDAGNLLGIYTGIKNGGVAGDSQAAVNAAQLGSKVGAFGGASGAVGTAAGYAAIPLSLYNFGKNWQSGSSGSDAVNGASAGASIGTAVAPGAGTLVGGLIGGAGGALSSLAGPGMKDPETADVQGLINWTSANGNNPISAQNAPDPYIGLAGLMDERSSTLPMYSQYGRMGEQAFTNDMVAQINNAIKSGQISASTPGSEVYSQVVAPWVNSMGSGWNNVGPTYTATAQGLLQDMVNQYMNGTAASSWKSVGGQYPFSNIYSGSSITPVQNQAMNDYLAMWKTLDTPMTPAQIQAQNAGGVGSRISATPVPSSQQSRFS